MKFNIKLETYEMSLILALLEKDINLNKTLEYKYDFCYWDKIRSINTYLKFYNEFLK